MAAVTATPKSIRPHLMVAEIEADSGYRYWSAPMASSLEMNLWIDQQEKFGGSISDLCCANGCWCVEEEGK